MDNKYILIAEDDSFIGKVYAKRLEKEDYIVKHVTNGKDLLDEIAKKTPDLILLDLIMPVMDGFDVLEELNNQKILSKLKIIVLSNLGQDEDITKAQQFGIKDYLVKTDNSLPEIVLKVSNYLK